MLVFVFNCLLFEDPLTYPIAVWTSYKYDLKAGVVLSAHFPAAASAQNPADILVGFIAASHVMSSWFYQSGRGKVWYNVELVNQMSRDRMYDQITTTFYSQFLLNKVLAR